MAAEAAVSDCQYSRVRSVNSVTDTNPAEIISGNASRIKGPGPQSERHQCANRDRIVCEEPDCDEPVEVEFMRVTECLL